MKRAPALAGAMLATTGFLAGCTGGEAAPTDPNAADRILIAQRNDCQGITAVEQVDQSQIRVTLNIVRPDESQGAMDRHPDPSILWLPPQVAASWLTTSETGEPKRNGSVRVTSNFGGYVAHEDFSPSVTLEVGTDPQPGQRVGVTLYSSAETTNFEDRKFSEVIAGSYCGTIVARLTTGDKGGIVWEVDPSAPPLEDLLKIRDCTLVQHPSQPSQYSRDC